jgi:hypothetical protein
VPRPLHGVLNWLGDRFSPITRWMGDRFSWLPKWSVPWFEAAAVAIVALAVAAFIRALVIAHRRAANDDVDGAAARRAQRDDPSALEVAADEAEARGDHAVAVRLRFRAGLLRLDRDAHVISYRPSLPTTDVRAELASPEFDDLADTFEKVTYGAVPAETTDTEAARREWPRVVGAARRR